MYLIKPRERFDQLDPEAFFYNDELSGRTEVFVHGFPEKSLIDWCLRHFQDSEAEFVDIGANVGSWAINLAPGFRHTHAFECNRSSFNCLCANLCLQNLSDVVTPHRVGLSEKPGELTFYGRGRGGGNDGFQAFEDRNVGTAEVMEVSTLDSFELTDIGFLKVDVEGHELEVLKGAQCTLENNDFPAFVFESWHEGREADGKPSIRLRKELFKYIKDTGYDITPLSGFREMFIARYIE